MKIIATCAHCGKALRSLHLALPLDLRPDAHIVTPTLNNCGSCGARGAFIANKEASSDLG